MKYQKLNLIVMAAMICASCWAPMKDPRQNVKINPEATAAQLAEMQRLQKTQGEVGYVPPVTDRPDVDSAQSDPSAKNTMAGAMSRMGGNDPSQKALLEADKKIHESPFALGGAGLWGILFLGLGMGSVFAVRQWANKNIPKMPRKRSGAW